MYDDAGIDGVLRKMEADYNEEEYDFFFRNCNHFCDDLSQRLLGDAPGCGVERGFMEEAVLAASRDASGCGFGAPEAAPKPPRRRRN